MLILLTFLFSGGESQESLSYNPDSVADSLLNAAWYFIKKADTGRATRLTSATLSTVAALTVLAGRVCESRKDLAIFSRMKETLDAIKKHPKRSAAQKENKRFLAHLHSAGSFLYLAQGYCYEALGDTGAALSSFSSGLSEAREMLNGSKCTYDSAMALALIADNLVAIGRLKLNPREPKAALQAFLKFKEAFGYYKKALLYGLKCDGEMPVEVGLHGMKGVFELWWEGLMELYHFSKGDPSLRRALAEFIILFGE